MIAIIDGNNLASRAKHANSELAAKGRLTGVGFGFFKSLRKLLMTYEDIEEVIICWDKGKSRYRAEKFVEYKTNRDAKKKDDDYKEYIRQLEEVQAILKFIPIRQIVLENVEADDVIAMLSEEVGDSYIISNDKDLFQLVVNNATILYKKGISNSGKYNELTSENFEKQLGLPVEKYVIYKALLGDTSDNIGGVKGMGDKRSKTLLAELNSIDDIEKFKDEKAFQKYITDESIEILKRNIDLMDLTSGHVLTDLEKEKINLHLKEDLPFMNTLKIQGYFLRNKYISLLENFSNFIEPFLRLRKKT